MLCEENSPRRHTYPLWKAFFSSSSRVAAGAGDGGETASLAIMCALTPRNRVQHKTKRASADGGSFSNLESPRQEAGR